MQRFTFAKRNILDKAQKSLKSLATTKFYINTYLLSKINMPGPDVSVVSYPKCGRTWLRMMLINYYHELGVYATRFTDSSLLQTDKQRIVKFDHDHGNWVPAPKSYKNIQVNKAKFQNHPVIFLIRHPGDVLVSSWYHLKYRENIYTGTLSEFIREELTGIRKVVEFMNRWLEFEDASEPYMALPYETMKTVPKASLEKVLEFLDTPPDKALIKKAVKASNFKSMKQMEASGSLKEPWMQPGSKQSEHSMKIRSGKVEAYREEMQPEDIKLVRSTIEQYGHPKLKALYLYH